MNYTNSEKVDMLLVYGLCERNARAAARLYAERYPHRRHPDHKAILNLENNLREFGMLQKDKKIPNLRNKTATDNDHAAAVLAYVHLQPHTSLSNIAAQCDISVASVWRILKKHKYHPYKFSRIQALCQGDSNRRLDFVSRILVNYHDDPQMLKRILWTDESRFHNNGQVSTQNTRYWSTEQPTWTRTRNNQHVFGINVWCGIIGEILIGPYFYEGTLTGNRYLSFLQDTLPGLLENVPLNIRNDMIFQQDSAPPHNSRNVQTYLDSIYENRWMGTNGPIKWPPRSPDITPLDYFLWGWLKSQVYSATVEHLDTQKNRIRTPVILFLQTF